MEWALLAMAVFFGFGAIGDEKQENRNNFTYICLGCIIAVMGIVIIKNIR